jgi:hypothetical protein
MDLNDFLPPMARRSWYFCQAQRVIAPQGQSDSNTA